MRYRSLRRLEGDVNEFVSRSDAKAHLRVDFTDDDALITSLIVAARRWAEDYCDTTFFLSQYTMLIDSFYGAVGSPIQFGLKADGNNIEGARKLDELRERLRAEKRSAAPTSIPPKAKDPASYLGRGRK